MGMSLLSCRNKVQETEALEQWELMSSQSGGHKSMLKVLVGLVSPEASPPGL